VGTVVAPETYREKMIKMASIERRPRNKTRPWAVRYRVDGRQRERSFATKCEAVAYRAEVEHGQR
jgi:hypothetical protein